MKTRSRDKNTKSKVDITRPDVFVMATPNGKKRKHRTASQIKDEASLSIVGEAPVPSKPKAHSLPKLGARKKRARRGMEESGPRQKRFTNKVRTGCLECKKAHVKCGEQKPKCSRCRRQGRQCTFDTPETWLFEPGQPSTRRESQASRASTAGNSPHGGTPIPTAIVTEQDNAMLGQPSGSAPLSRRPSAQSSEQPASFQSLYASLQGYDPNTAFVLESSSISDDLGRAYSPQSNVIRSLPYENPEEEMSLQYYLDNIIPVMTRYVGSPYIWKQVFIQLLWQHPAVKYALIAFSMDYQALEREASGLAPSSALQPLRYFSRAVNALTEEHAALEVVIVAGYLFWTSDMFHGRWSTVSMHIRSGLSIIEEARTRAERQGEIVGTDTGFIFTYMYGTLQTCRNFVEIQKSRAGEQGLGSVVRSRYHEQLQSTSVAQVHRHMMVVTTSLKRFAERLSRSTSLAAAFESLTDSLSGAVNEMEEIIVHFPLPFRTEPTLDVAKNEHYRTLFDIIYASDDSVTQICAVLDALNTLVLGDNGEEQEQEASLALTLLTRIERLLPVFVRAITSTDLTERGDAIERLKTARYISI